MSAGAAERSPSRKHDRAPSLRDARVLLARPREDVESLARRIEEEGGVALVVPLVRIGPPEDGAALEAARREAHRAGWLVFTSRHAARIFLEGMEPPKGARPMVAAVGASTRNEILRAGWPVDLTGEGKGAAALASEIALRDDLREAPVIHPRSDLAGDELASILGKAGAEVRSVTAYRTLPAEVTEDDGRLLRGGAYDLVHFASPSAVRRFVDLVDRAGEILSRIGAVGIGPTTTEALREAGARLALEAEKPDDASVLDALRAARRRREPEEGNEK